MQVILAGFSVRLLCFEQVKFLCLYFFAELVFVCVDVMVISFVYGMT